MPQTATSANRYFVIDFDSTFTRVEALDELAKIALQGDELEKGLARIQEITDLGMAGKVSLRQSLEERVSILHATRAHIDQLIEVLKEKVSYSVQRNKTFFQEHADQIYIVSNGFADFIVPIVADYGIAADHVFANDFTYDSEGNITGLNRDNALSANNGKAAVIKDLNLSGDIYVIGDGYTDYEIKASGLANKFYAFTENVERDAVTEKADHIAPSMDELLYDLKLNTAISFPKNRIKVLLLENVHPRAVQILEKEGYSVRLEKDAMDEEELSEAIKDVSVLGIRSKTQLTRKVLQHANRLMVVGTFSVGTNQVDLPACQEKGIAVFNAPFSNTRSVVELAIAHMVYLSRNLPDKVMGMHRGQWKKSATGSFEVRGKSLGIVGYGNIGTQLSVLAEAMGMRVFFFDLKDKQALGNATRCHSLEEMLEVVDFLSLHVDGRKSNENMIGEEQLALMKPGSYLLNLSRGHVVDIDALQAALKSGHLAGAAVDVFPEEPKSNSEPFESALMGLSNVALTPHIGGSTQEAQENIGQYVPGKIISYINSGSTTNCVNIPELQLPELEGGHRLLHVHHNRPGVLSKINEALTKHGTNIIGQYLKTNETIGYVITDIDKQYERGLIQDLKAIGDTIKFRILY